MLHGERHTIEVTTDGSGDATAYIPADGGGNITGDVLNIHYVKDGSNSYADGVDFAITAEATGQNIWTEENVNASKTVAPSQVIHTEAGVEDAGRDFIRLVNDRIKIVIASGGASKTGRFVAVIG